MGLIKFELKEDHIKLLNNLQWSMTETNHILSINDLDNDDVEDVAITPFGGDDLILDIGEIIYGMQDGLDIKPIGFEVDEQIGEIEDDEMGKVSYTDEQIEEMTELFNGLATALDICLYTQAFEVGHYKRKYYLRDWKKYEPKK